MSEPSDNFSDCPTPRCKRCGDSGLVLEHTAMRYAEVSALVPCDCAAGRAREGIVEARSGDLYDELNDGIGDSDG